MSNLQDEALGGKTNEECIKMAMINLMYTWHRIYSCPMAPDVQPTAAKPR